MTPESKIKKEIDAYLKTLGHNWWGFKPMMMGYGRKGIPDIIGCYKGYFVALEVKSDIGKLTPWQEAELNAIKCADGAAFVVRSVDEAKKALLHVLHWENIRDKL